jgi:hypothetical protein
MGVESRRSSPAAFASWDSYDAQGKNTVRKNMDSRERDASATNPVKPETMSLES